MSICSFVVDDWSCDVDVEWRWDLQVESHGDIYSADEERVGDDMAGFCAEYHTTRVSRQRLLRDSPEADSLP
jgi:hypothetical protein